MKILETRHSGIQYFLVFDKTEIVGKFETLEEARNFIKSQKQ